MKLVKYVQPSCVPCKMVEAFMNHLGATVDETLDISVESNFARAQELNVKSTPTIMLLDDNGNEIDRAVGMQQDKIKELIALRD